MPKLQLSFHTSFALKKEDLLKILNAASEDHSLSMTQELLMEKTGLGNKKVGPMKSWAIRSGLTTKDSLSPEGKIVLAQDPYLESPITDWLMHFYLSLGDKGLAAPPANPAEWGGWTWFVYSFLPAHPKFTKDELVGYASQVFEEDAAKPKFKDNLQHILKAYAVPPDPAKKETPALKGCRFIQSSDEKSYNHFYTGQAHLPNPFMVGYFLAKLWQRDFTDETSVYTNDLISHPMGLAPLLGISSEAVQEQLNLLSTYGLIEQWREVTPFRVVARWEDPLTLLEKAYSIMP